MKEEVISFETAKLAKEKGFNENSKGYYNKEGEFIEAALPQGSKFNVGDDNVFSAPTQSLLQKWLREELKLSVETVFNGSESFYWIIREMYPLGKEFSSVWDERFGWSTYEEAMDAALLKALNLI